MPTSDAGTPRDTTSPPRQYLANLEHCTVVLTWQSESELWALSLLADHVSAGADLTDDELAKLFALIAATQAPA